jgi:hypothetical protein
MFRALSEKSRVPEEPPPGSPRDGPIVYDYGHGTVADRINKFFSQSPEVANEIYHPLEQQAIKRYGAMRRIMAVPQAGANWSGTARPVVNAIQRQSARWVLATLGSHIGHLPGAIAGYLAGPMIAHLADLRSAAALSNQLPSLATYAARWQQAVSRAARLNNGPSRTYAGITAANMARIASKFNINPSMLARAATGEDENKNAGPQDQKRDGGGVQPKARLHGGTVGDSASVKPRNHPVIHGAMLAPDNEYYLKDPNRPGKFLKVIERGRQHTAA